MASGREALERSSSIFNLSTSTIKIMSLPTPTNGHGPGPQGSKKPSRSA